MVGNREFDRSETNELTSGVSGGYNTAASDLLTPLTDSPDMNNVQVDFDGMVRKRKGVKTLFTRNETGAGERSFVNGSFVIPIQTASGRPLLLIRENYTITVMGLQDDGSWVEMLNMSNVFGSKVNEVSEYTFDYIIQYEPLYTRVILVHPNQIPVQISIVSTHLPTFSKGSTSATWSVPNLPVGFASANNASAYVRLFVNGTYSAAQSGAMTSPLADGAVTLGFQTPSVYNSGTYDLEVLYFGYQHWCESLFLGGEQLHASVVQGVNTKTVSIPSSLLSAIAPYSGIAPPIRAYTTTGYDALFGIAAIPLSASQYVWTDGAIADGVSSPSRGYGFLSFGGVPAATRSVSIVRGYKLPFQGNQGASWVAANTQVYSDLARSDWQRYAVSPPTEGGAGVGTIRGYTLRGGSDYLVKTTLLGRTQNFITLDANSTINGGLSLVSAAERYWIMDVDNNTLANSGYAGTNINWYMIAGIFSVPQSIISISAAYAPDYPPVPYPGAFFPAPGISWYADYKRGSFPSCISTLQGRTALAGFRDLPLTIVISNPYDTDSAGLFANNFDTVYTLPSEVSPFDITLPGKDNDSITDMVEYNDSLFVFTKFRIFRIHAQGALVNTSNARYSLVAEIGVQNNRSVAVTDDYPVFLSTAGVFALVPDDTSAGYSVQELSVKVRNFFQTHNDTIRDVGFILYDSGRNELYVGTSDNTKRDRCGILMVFNLRLQAWYPFTIAGGVSFQAYWAGLLWDNRYNTEVIEPKVIFTQYATSNDDDYMQVVQMNEEDVPVDMVEKVTWTANPVNSRLPALQISQSIITDCREYDPTNIELYGENVFRMCPIRDLQDVVVTIDGVTQVFGTDYVKTERGTLFFPTAPTGTTLTATYQSTCGGTLYHPVTVFNETTGQLYQFDEITVEINSGKYRVTIPDGVTSGDSIWICYSFPSWYTTPTFNASTLKVKRIKEYIGYYHNSVSKIIGITDAYATADKIGQRLAPLNVNIGVLFSNEFEGLLQYDLYTDLSPDTYPNQQLKNYSRISVPIIGNGYNIQIVHHNNTPSTFKLAGYEIDYTAKPGKGYSKSTENLN